MTGDKGTVYRVTFRTPKGEFSICCREVGNSNVMGFVEMGEIIWPEESLIVLPDAVDLRAEFKGVKRLSVSVYAILQIEELEEEEPSRHVGEGGRVHQFPRNTVI